MCLRADDETHAPCRHPRRSQMHASCAADERDVRPFVHDHDERLAADSGTDGCGARPQLAVRQIVFA